MRFTQRLTLKYIRTKFRILSAVSKKLAAEKAFELFCTPRHRNLKPLPPIFQKAEKLVFPFEEYTIYGYRWNHPALKKVMILHGFESSVVNFENYVKLLIDKGYEVMAFDAPAHGRSTGKTVTVVTYKKLVEYILDTYGPVTSFIAHSFGGLTISLVLEEWSHDDSFKVVLIAPATETTTAIDNFFILLKLDGEVRREFETLITKLSGHPPSWYSVIRAAQHIKAEVLFLQDKDDHMTPVKDVEPLIQKKYPNFHFIISEGLGHRRIYRDNKTAKAIADFL